MSRALRLALALLLGLPCWGPVSAAPAVQRPSEAGPEDEVEPAPSKGRVSPAPELEELLKQNDFRVQKDGSLFKSQGNITISRDLLKHAGIDFSKQGKLVYTKDNLFIPVKNDQIIGILNGLLPFARAAKLSPGKVGKTLQEWGLPAVFDGSHLLNPDGTATYFGLMFYQGMIEKPEALKLLKNKELPVSGERLSKSLELFNEAYGQAFNDQSPDSGASALSRAWNMLSWSKLRDGETPVALKPYDAETALKAYKKEIAEARGKANDAQYKEQLKDSLKALKTLELYHYHTDLNLPDQKEDLDLPEAPPRHALLPALLGTLDQVNGKPLTPEQQEWLVKSFPMGEVVWRAGVQQLWREGLTGKGVKVAVIDTGVGFHPDLNKSVALREGFTHQRGPGTIGEHATHVAGTIHALAPDAEIRSYQALEDDILYPNKLLEHKGEDEVNRSIMDAVDKAVRDGNQVINLSFGGAGSPSGPLAQKIEEYARQGVIFVVSAGNEADKHNVESPGNAPSAITAGALDINRRFATFSSGGASASGENYDQAKMSYVIKTVFMAPGKNIVSTLPSKIAEEYSYGKKSGTSMAAPSLSGEAALLVQGCGQYNLVSDPVTLSRRVKDALQSSGRPIPRNELPSGTPPEQDFIIVDPAAAWRALKPQQPTP